MRNRTFLFLNIIINILISLPHQKDPQNPLVIVFTRTVSKGMYYLYYGTYIYVCLHASGNTS